MQDKVLQEAFQTAAVGMALVGLSGAWLRVNRAACEILGYAERELLMLAYQDLLHPDDCFANREHVGKLIQGSPEIFRTEKRFRHKKGHYLWLSLSSSLVRGDGGEAECYFVQLQDISLQKEAELVREKLFELPVALHFAASFDGYFTKLSPSWSDVLGFPLEQLMAVPYMDFVHDEDRTNTANAAHQLADGRHVFLFENRYRHYNGSYRWLLWAAVSVQDQRTIYGVALDYTVRKETELELERTLREMERLVADLTASQREIDTLRKGLITVCAWTKKVQHEGRWMTIDEFLHDHLRLKLSHGISQEALDEMMIEIERKGI